VNLPNAITVARIAAAPLTAFLILQPEHQLRWVAWVLYIAAAVTDYWDGKLARERNLVTDLGRLLDPLADKLLLLCTLVPMWWLQRGVAMGAPLPEPGTWAAGETIGPVIRETMNGIAYPFIAPGMLVGLHGALVIVVLGREAFMTVLRQIAARRGVIISAIGPAKWKTGFQSTWAGAAFFWFAAAATATHYAWRGPAWGYFALFNGIVGVVSMAGAVVLTLYSLWLYLARYGYVLSGRAPRATR
jgi:phosphatidylglycerophosphate synthase